MFAHIPQHLKAFVLFGFGCVMAHSAMAGPITLDLSKIGISGAPVFTADALKASEVSHIALTGPTTFFEHGYVIVTGILRNGVVTTPIGLNSTYSLYFDFTATGSVATSQIDTLGMTLFAVSGAATFGIDANNNAFVNTGSNVPVALATNALISGTIGGAPGTDLSAETFSTFSATAAGGPVFVSPPLPDVFHGAFFHSIQEPGGIALVADGFVLRGGDDTLTFVPEPASLMLMIAGLPGLWLLRRKARA